MTDIYWNATICIVAGSGLDSTAGLPGISLSQSIPQDCKKSIREDVSVGIPRPPFSDLIGQSRWIRRAWTFQELVLSKRCLIFTEAEASYYCGMSTYREPMIEDADSEREYWSRDGNMHLLGNATVIKATEGTDGLCRMYEAAVLEYTCRSLSCQTDGLNAFQGLSHLVGKLLGTEMVFGVPTCMLIASFVWRP
jgi:Heterokaryon incompatibility protein (HET)